MQRGVDTEAEDRATQLHGALSDRLELLLHDPQTRARLGREASRWAADHRWPCVAEAVCRLYSELRPQALSHLSRGRCQT